MNLRSDDPGHPFHRKCRYDGAIPGALTGGASDDLFHRSWRRGRRGHGRARHDGPTSGQAGRRTSCGPPLTWSAGPGAGRSSRRSRRPSRRLSRSSYRRPSSRRNRSRCRPAGRRSNCRPGHRRNCPPSRHHPPSGRLVRRSLGDRSRPALRPGTAPPSPRRSAGTATQVVHIFAMSKHSCGGFAT